MAEKVDFIEKEFNKMGSKFEGVLSNTLQDIGTMYETNFGDNGKFSSLLERRFGDNGTIVKELFNPYKEGTPLFSLWREIKLELENLKQQVGINKEVEKIKEKTPLKGLDFEKYCEAILNNLAKVHGDSLENTSTKPGKLLSSKKGDYVVRFGNNTGKRLVIELKNVDKQFSTKDIQDELEQAKKNREADYALLVVKCVESVPKSVCWWGEYNGHNLVCALGNRDGNSSLHEEILCSL